MKLSLLVITVILSLYSPSFSEECRPDEWCTEFSPCSRSVPAGDRCNTANEMVYCKDGKWYSLGIFSVTTMYCTPRPIEIENLFKGK
jgi:hypothetical protein